MPALFKAKHLKRYKEIVALLVKYGLSEVVRGSSLGELLGGETGPLGKRVHPEPNELAHDLEHLGPTFVKLGQMLSTRADIVPVRYLDSLAQLQDRVGPVPYAEVEQVLRSELGRPLMDVFASFDEAPLAAASLGQVHRATLHDGRKVAVKVQRPDIRAKLADDLEVLDEVAGMLEVATDLARRYEFRRIVAELRRTLMRELDYLEEARNLQTLAEILDSFPHMTVPRAYDDISTARVLVMDFVEGVKVAPEAVEKLGPEHAGMLARELLDAFIRQVCIDGFFHADPHPGNVLLTPDGKLALIDLGMVAHITPGNREHLLRLLLAVGEGRGGEVADLCLHIGEPKDQFDENTMRRMVADIVATQQGANVAQAQLGKTVLEIARAAGDSGVRVPRELTMLGKAMMSLDQLGRMLDPKFDPYAYIRAHAPGLILSQLRRGVNSASVVARALEVNEFVTRLPGRVNRILDRVADNRLEVKVRSIDEQRLTEGLQKVANRIAEGLLVAAMIIAGATLMGVPTSFRVLGYPFLSVLLFFLAFCGAVILYIDIQRHDRRKR